MTRQKCDISRTVGINFELLDGLVSGKNLQLVTDTKIVQKWRKYALAHSHARILTYMYANARTRTYSYARIVLCTHLPIRRLFKIGESICAKTNTHARTCACCVARVSNSCCFGYENFAEVVKVFAYTRAPALHIRTRIILTHPPSHARTRPHAYIPGGVLYCGRN